MASNTLRVMWLQQDHPNESFPITAARIAVDRSFIKLKFIKMFHRSTMTDERLTNLTMISIESENAKTLDMTELTKTIAFLNLESHFPSLKYRKY